MSPYILILILLLVCSQFNNKLSYNVAFICLTVFLIVRFGQGTDWGAYCYIFNAAPKSIDISNAYYSDSYHSEIGWKLLMNVFKMLELKYTTVSIILGSAEMLAIGNCIQKYSRVPTLSLLMLYPTCYLTYLFSALREGLVVAIFLGAMIDCLFKKRLKMYFVLCIVCISLHSVAVVLLLAPFLKNIKLSALAPILTASVLLGMLGYIWLPRMFSLIGVKYGVNISIVAVFYRLTSGLLVYFALKNMRTEPDEHSSVLLVIYVTGIAIYSILFEFSTVASRTAILFLAVDVILLPNLLASGSFLQSKIVKTLLILSLSLMTIKNLDSYCTQGRYYSEYKWYNYPYCTIFDRDYYYRTNESPFNIYILNS